MRVLITSAAGVVGTAVIQRLGEEHVLLRLDSQPQPAINGEAIQADLRDWRQVRAALVPHAPIDAVVHLAYAATDTELCWEDQAVEQFDVTVRGTWVTLAESYRLGAWRFLFASSLNVYGDLGDGPYPESFDVVSSSRLDPTDPYGVCKYLAEQLMGRFCATRGVHVDDISEAFARALVMPLEGFDVVNLVADPTRHDAPNDKIQHLLNWAPRHVFAHRPDLETWGSRPAH
ncbi:MAG: NAD-dependent epimerase/dehydratase family protein [Chloroflexi bacterium]|nr:NAD-dependent epimerase/dehydratase family protein [Chloroflexota bacterium]